MKMSSLLFFLPIRFYFTGTNSSFTDWKPVQASGVLLPLLFRGNFKEKRLWKR
jgi:hypothetical protein